ncbi:Hsp20/alpha crystallin family protein [Sphingobium aquiterrae]|uniref:Hsp20/alpha crystallin family protein n=1 Tax=Sphingobium aquiterrae TaxID=2038656 RepID=UPI0030160542
MNEMTTATPARTASNRSLLPEGGPLGWLRGEIDRLFDDFGSPGLGGPGQSLFHFATRSDGPVPAMALTDGGKAYSLSVELPGLSDQDVQIDVADGVLTLCGEKKEESERKEGGYLLNERRYGSFTRQIALPADVDPEAIKAKFQNGVLSITLGKDEKVAPRSRKIAIER